MPSTEIAVFSIRLTREYTRSRISGGGYIYRAINLVTGELLLTAYDETKFLDQVREIPGHDGSIYAHSIYAHTEVTVEGPPPASSHLSATMRWSGQCWVMHFAGVVVDAPLINGTGLGVDASIEALVSAALNVLDGPENAVLHILPPLPDQRVIVTVEDGVVQPPCSYWSLVTTPRALLRRDHEIADVDPIIAAIHVATNALARTTSRSRAAYVAACSYVLDEEIPGCDAWVQCRTAALPPRLAQMPHEQVRWARLLCEVDLHGIGGPGGLGGPQGGTDRISAFSALGKGRRHASDGSAWSTAIAQAASLGNAPRVPTSVSPEVGLALVAGGVLRDSDLVWGLVYALHSAYTLRNSPVLSRQWIAVARAAVGAAERHQLDARSKRLSDRYGVTPLTLEEGDRDHQSAA